MIHHVEATINKTGFLYKTVFPIGRKEFCISCRRKEKNAKCHASWLHTGHLAETEGSAAQLMLLRMILSVSFQNCKLTSRT